MMTNREDLKTVYDMWNDQVSFNRLLRDPPVSYAERTAQTKELVLHLISETDELLRASGAWKSHRKLEVKENRRHVNEELIDIFKCWLSLCDIHGLTPDLWLDEYQRKSAVVRMNHSQEWTSAIDRNDLIVIVDIDGVLGNYIVTFAAWALRYGFLTPEEANRLVRDNIYLTREEFPRLTPEQYDTMRHEFRISGYHADLHLKPGAREFMQWIQSQGWKAVVLTSRPFDAYPNLHAETLQWLKANHLPFQALWWSNKKADLCVERGIRKQILFAVDDEQRHIEQFTQQGIKSYWIGGDANARISTVMNERWYNVSVVETLDTVQRMFEEEVFRHGK